MLKLVTAPNPVLTTPTKKIQKVDKSIISLVGQMEKTLISQTDPKGVGLAATQIGIGISLFIMKPSQKVKTEVMINPRIIEHGTWNMEHGTKKAKIPVSNDLPAGKAGLRGAEQSEHAHGVRNTVSSDNSQQDPSSLPKKKKKQPLEGCLSIPRIWSPVARSQKVMLEYMDLKGKIHKKWFSGLRAVIVQHEIDHLNGILFTQRALEQNEQLFEEKDGKLKKISS